MVAGGGGRPVEGGRLLLAEETGGCVWSVVVFRKFTGNLIPVSSSLLLLSVVDPLFLIIVGLFCWVIYNVFGVFIHVIYWVFYTIPWSIDSCLWFPLLVFLIY